MSFHIVARSTARWVFGLSVTVLFIALWGRAVVVDTDLIAESAAPLASSATVVDMFTEWIEAELIDNGVDPSLAAPAVDYVLETAAVGEVLDDFVAEVIRAASDPTSTPASVDVATLLSPAIPEIGTTLRAAGVRIPVDDVNRIISDLDPLVIRPAGTPPYVGEGSRTAVRLGTAAVLAFLVMVVSGSIAVNAAEDRLAEARTLLTRIALGGFTFGLLLRLGSWVLDPSGGRAPLSQSLSNLADSKWVVPIGVATVAATLAVVTYLIRGSVTQTAEFRRRDEPPTQELELVPSSPAGR